MHTWLFSSGAHWSTESAEVMRIKCFAQGLIALIQVRIESPISSSSHRLLARANNNLLHLLRPCLLVNLLRFRTFLLRIWPMSEHREPRATSLQCYSHPVLFDGMYVEILWSWSKRMLCVYSAMLIVLLYKWIIPSLTDIECISFNGIQNLRIYEWSFLSFVVFINAKQVM